MEDIFPESLINLILISMSFSFINMSLIQKFKSLNFVTKSSTIGFLNLFFSFLIGIPFGIYFYQTTVLEGVWIGLFTFIGAPTLYETLKTQNILTYKPKSLTSSVEIPIENEIKTENLKN